MIDAGIGVDEAWREGSALINALPYRISLERNEKSLNAAIKTDTIKGFCAETILKKSHQLVSCLVQLERA